MMYDVDKNTWKVKTLNNSVHEFLYYASAVSLPNGDALITGGGSSTTVYQYTSNGDLLVKKSMSQMRKEHSAVICD